MFSFNSSYVCVCVCVCASLHMNAGTQGVQRSRIIQQLSYIQTVVNQPTLVLRTKLRSSARAGSTLDCQTFYNAPI